MFMKKRGQLIWDRLIPWFISLAVFVLIVGLYIILIDKGEGTLAYVKNFFRFGRA